LRHCVFLTVKYPPLSLVCIIKTGIIRRCSPALWLFLLIHAKIKTNKNSDGRRSLIIMSLARHHSAVFASFVHFIYIINVKQQIRCARTPSKLVVIVLIQLFLMSCYALTACKIFGFGRKSRLIANFRQLQDIIQLLTHYALKANTKQLQGYFCFGVCILRQKLAIFLSAACIIQTKRLFL